MKNICEIETLIPAGADEYKVPRRSAQIHCTNYKSEIKSNDLCIFKLQYSEYFYNRLETHNAYFPLSTLDRVSIIEMSC